MPDKMTEVIEELALANRILAHEGVLDAFGHVSVRHPTDPGRYLLSRSRSPAVIEPDDILEFTLDSQPVRPPKVQLYAERVIHGCIFAARSDVMAVVHHHAPAIMPFAIVGKPEEGQSLARALGKHSAVMMNRHGATVVGGSLKEMVSRAIFMCQNADYQLQAMTLGKPQPLYPGEVKLAGSLSLLPNVVTRTWEYWSMRLAASGALPPRRSNAKATRRPVPKTSRVTPRERRKGRRR